MAVEPPETGSPWSGLTLSSLLDDSGQLNAVELFARSALPDAPLPAERVIDRLARVPGGSQFSRQEALRELLEGSDSPDAVLGATIADAARKLATLNNSIEEVIDSWESERWETLQCILQHERELLALRAHLRALPSPDTDAAKLRKAAGIAQEELAGLIGILDSFRLTARHEQAMLAQQEGSDGPAFAQADSVLRLLQAQQERKKAA
ncbi:MAG: hypothetical protein QM758_24660 [Armatimonas sp.]